MTSELVEVRKVSLIYSRETCYMADLGVGGGDGSSNMAKRRKIVEEDDENPKLNDNVNVVNWGSNGLPWSRTLWGSFTAEEEQEPEFSLFDERIRHVWKAHGIEVEYIIKKPNKGFYIFEFNTHPREGPQPVQFHVAFDGTQSTEGQAEGARSSRLENQAVEDGQASVMDFEDGGATSSNGITTGGGEEGILDSREKRDTAVLGVGGGDGSSNMAKKRKIGEEGDGNPKLNIRGRLVL